MEMRIIFPVLSMMSCGVFHTATSASLREDTVTTTSLPVHHVRAKRCSCATFLDKECVYFCHLDIIWVNTPERTVSYGLGNVPRKKRSVRSFPYTTQSARCKCLGRGDSQCASFCDARDPAGHEIGADSVNRVAVGKGCAEEQSKHKPVWITRAKGKSQRPADPSVLRVSRKTLLLLGSWWSRQPPRTRPWTAENSAP